MKIKLTMRSGKTIVLDEIPVHMEISHNNGEESITLPSIVVDVFNPIVIKGKEYGILVNRKHGGRHSGITLTSEGGSMGRGIGSSSNTQPKKNPFYIKESEGIVE
jgi:hypothetical protein